MKKAIHLIVAIALLAGSSLVWASPARAQVVTPGDSVSFLELGVQERALTGPFDIMTVPFRVPADWQLGGGAELVLNFNTFFGTSTTATEAAVTTGGTVEVGLNDEVLATILLDRLGERTVVVPITASALAAVGASRRHSLDLFLDAGLDCEFHRQTTVVVRSTSTVRLPHTPAAPTTDLSLLPLPIFQNSFRPDQATIVVPDQPSAADLQAALSVAAGFGRMSAGALGLSLVPAGQLSDAARLSSHLIVVGQAQNLPMLSAITLPANPVEGSFAVPGQNPDDGVVQMAASPWNPSGAVLVVSGNSEAAVIKAGQAVSSGQILVNTQKNIALVADTQPGLTFGAADSLAAERTLGDLGYEARTMNRLGSNILEYTFYIPTGQVPAADATLELRFNNSALLNFERSALNVSLNGQSMGSRRLDAETAVDGSLRAILRATELRPGPNLLTIQTDLVPVITCSFDLGANRGYLTDARQAGLWLTVWPDSTLNLPLTADTSARLPRFDLSLYPDPFNATSRLTRLAFVVPPDDPVPWDVAARLAFDLGDTPGAGAIFAPRLAFGDAIPDDVWAGHDLIIVGRPSTLMVVAELAEWWPAPFEAGSDLALEKSAKVIYRLPPGANVGYLELMASPRNESRAVLGVLGSTSQGLQWAGAALTTPALRGKLVGNIAVVSGEQVIADDTRGLAGESGLLATAVPGGEFEPVPEGAPSPAYQRPYWILPVLGASLLLMLGVLVLVFINSRPRRMPARSK